MNIAENIMRLTTEGKVAEAEALMLRAGIDRDQRPQSLYLQGFVAFAKDDLRTARVKFSRAVKGAPGFVLPVIGLGNCHLKLGDFHEAIRVLADAEALAPGDPAVLGNIGLAYRELGQFDEAKAVLEAARKRDPSNVAVLLTLASIHEKLGDIESALVVIAGGPRTPEMAAAEQSLRQRQADGRPEV